MLSMTASGTLMRCQCVDHADRWSLDAGVLSHHLVHGRGEDDERCLAWKRPGRDQDAVEASTAGVIGKRLAPCPVVGDQLLLVDVELIADALIGEVKDGEVLDSGAADAASDLEG